MSDDEFVDPDLLGSAADEREEDPAQDVEVPEARRDLERKTLEMEERLRKLRQEQEELELKRGELEDLRRRQDQFLRERRAVREDLAQAVVLLEREIAAITDRLEWMRTTRDGFREKLAQIDAIDENTWTEENLREEVDFGLRLLSDARVEHARAQSRLQEMIQAGGSRRDDGAESETPRAAASFGLGEMVRLGLAVALPVAVVVVISLVILTWILRSPAM